MNYKEQLQKANEMGLDIISLQVANEVSCTFYEIELTDKEFELCCSTIENAYLKSEYLSVWNITKALRDLIKNQVLDEEEKIYNSIEELIDNTSKCNLIEKASWYE